MSVRIIIIIITFIYVLTESHDNNTNDQKYQQQQQQQFANTVLLTVHLRHAHSPVLRDHMMVCRFRVYDTRMLVEIHTNNSRKCMV